MNLFDPFGPLRLPPSVTLPVRFCLELVIIGCGCGVGKPILKVSYPGSFSVASSIQSMCDKRDVVAFKRNRSIGRHREATQPVSLCMSAC